MHYQNGYWATYVRKRKPNLSVYGSAKILGIKLRRLYECLDGGRWAISKDKFRGLCKLWRVSQRELRATIEAHAAEKRSGTPSRSDNGVNVERPTSGAERLPVPPSRKRIAKAIRSKR